MTMAMDGSAPIVGLKRDGDELARLLAAAARGDSKALERLYARTSAKLYGICLRMLRSDAEAEEALQDIYVTIWRNAGRFDPAKASALTWLSVLARNKAIDRLRARRMPAANLDEAADVADEGPLPFELIERAEDRDRLNRCLGELEERFQGLIRAAFLDGLTYPELAEREAVPLGTMKSWIRRSLIRLKGCLER